MYSLLRDMESSYIDHELARELIQVEIGNLSSVEYSTEAVFALFSEFSITNDVPVKLSEVIRQISEIDVSKLNCTLDLFLSREATRWYNYYGPTPDDHQLFEALLT